MSNISNGGMATGGDCRLKTSAILTILQIPRSKGRGALARQWSRHNSLAKRFAMNIFVINLDKNPERLLWIKNQLDSFGMAFERFAAVLGSALPPDEYRRSTSPFRSLMAYGALLEKGEVGCALSHLAVYRRIVSDGLPYALILEDDCTFSRDFPRILKEVETFVKADKKQVVLLSAHGVSDELRNRDMGIVPIRTCTCADAYVITNTAAQAILNANYPVVVPCDTWARFHKLFKVELYRATPCTVWQDSRFSTENQKNHKPYRGYPKFVWKSFRAFGVTVDLAMHWLKKLQQSVRY